MTASTSKDARFETPTLDSLTPKRRDLVYAYCKSLDKEVAASAAGYHDKSAKQRQKKIYELFHEPEILKAIEEQLESTLAQLDNGRAALITRMMHQSLAVISDVMEFDTEEMCWKPKPPEKVLPQYHAAMGLIKDNRDRTYAFDTMSQVRITNQLSKLMLWDQQELDQQTPINFMFGAVQNETYVAPDHQGADLSNVTDDSDEIDKLTH
jgi:phage terminase small subunit